MLLTLRAALERKEARAGFGSKGLLYAEDWERRLVEEMEDGARVAARKLFAKRVPAMEPLILRMRKAGLLPAIWFILSRKARQLHGQLMSQLMVLATLPNLLYPPGQDCDLAAIRATSGALLLASSEEQAEIRAEVRALGPREPFTPVALTHALWAPSGCTAEGRPARGSA